jgi:hypothetical protein
MPDIRKVIDQLVDPGMLSERQLSMTKTFNMSKGDALEIPADLFRAGDDFVSEIPTFAFAFALLSPLTLLSLATFSRTNTVHWPRMGISRQLRSRRQFNPARQGQQTRRHNLLRKQNQSLQIWEWILR